MGYILHTYWALWSIVKYSLDDRSPKASPSGLERWAFAHGCPAKLLKQTLLGEFFLEKYMSIYKHQTPWYHGIYGDLMGFYSDLIRYEWDIPSGEHTKSN